MIVVTGGAGFIGSALVWRLNELGETDILVVDDLGSDEKWRNLNGLRFRDYQEKDAFLADVQAGTLDPHPIETLFHLGACSSTTETDARYLIQNNFEYTKTLARFAVRREIRFVYASSAATYGDGSQGYADTEELTPALLPLNMYGYSKQLFDAWALREGLLKKLVGLKYFNVFGPNEWHKGDMRSMVCKGYEQIEAEGAIRLFKSHRPDYGDGEQERDFLYVKDAVDMTLFFHTAREPMGLFNVGTGTSRTWNDLARAIFAALERPPRIHYIDMPETLRARYQYHTRAEPQKLRDAGYRQPTAPLEAAVADYVRHYLVPGRHLGGAPVG